MVMDRIKVVASVEIAEATGISLPTVSKILKILVKSGVLNSVRGARGGYRLARAPEKISVAEVICALEGPIAVTECSISDHNCEQSPKCSIRGNWTVINTAIQSALESVSVADLTQPGNVAIDGLKVPVESLYRKRRQKEFGESNVS